MKPLGGAVADSRSAYPGGGFLGWWWRGEGSEVCAGGVILRTLVRKVSENEAW